MPHSAHLQLLRADISALGTYAKNPTALFDVSAPFVYIQIIISLIVSVKWSSLTLIVSHYFRLSRSRRNCLKYFAIHTNMLTLYSIFFKFEENK